MRKPKWAINKKYLPLEYLVANDNQSSSFPLGRAHESSSTEQGQPLKQRHEDLYVLWLPSFCNSDFSCRQPRDCRAMLGIMSSLLKVFNFSPMYKAYNAIFIGCPNIQNCLNDNTSTPRFLCIMLKTVQCPVWAWKRAVHFSLNLLIDKVLWN